MSKDKPVKEEKKDRDMEIIEISKEEYDALLKDREEKKEWQELAARIKADYENARKRLEREKEEFIRFAQYNVLKDLLAVLDDFERAHSAALETGDIESLIKGLDMIGKDLHSLLKRYGVEEIDARGKKFDPELHEALMQEDNAEEEPFTVLSVLQKGYTMHGKVLRPARVKVSVASEEKGSSEENEIEEVKQDD